MKSLLQRLATRERQFLMVTMSLWLLPVAIFFLREDNIDRGFRRLSNSGSIDCGRAYSKATEQPSATVDACVVAAYKTGKPFYARYDEDVVDDMWRSHTIVSIGIVGTDKGQIYFLYDRLNPCGKSNFKRQYLCSAPQVVTDFGRTHLICSSDSCG